MHTTIYTTPIIRQFFVALAWTSLKITGWKMEGHPPNAPKYVIIAAPHTSNWDFPIMIAMAFLLRFEIYWMGKDSLFKGPAGPIMRWFGGVPIDRSKGNNVVQHTINAFNDHDRLIILIPPEGTRSRVQKWKTGFYHISHGAGVPIGLGFLDFTRKAGGFGPTFHTTGNMEDDIAEIQSFYKDIIGKNPDNFTPIG